MIQNRSGSCACHYLKKYITTKKISEKVLKLQSISIAILYHLDLQLINTKEVAQVERQPSLPSKRIILITMVKIVQNSRE
jgi:hypothetical protein